MNRLIIFPYKFGSKSAKELQKALPAVRVRDIGRYHKKEGDFIINWGNSKTPSFGRADLNCYESVAISTDKVASFERLNEHGVRTPLFTQSRSVSQRLVNDGNTIYARTLTKSHGGKGIVVCSGTDIVPHAKLYTVGINVKNEYRVHVFNGEVIDYCKKVPMEGSELTIEQQKVKNHTNGYTFARNIKQRDDVKDIAVEAVSAMGLDFGAVDIVVSNDNNMPYVLEVNSAPGIEGKTVGIYVDAIKKYMESYEDVPVMDEVDDEDIDRMIDEAIEEEEEDDEDDDEEF